MEITPLAETPVSPEEGEPSESVALVPFSQLSKKEVRQRVREELAGRSLTGWEGEFCRWLALQEKKVPEREQLAVATGLANRRVMRKELQGLKRRGPYVRLFAKEQGSQIDKEIERAKAIASRVMPKGMQLAEHMVDAATDAITDKDAKTSEKLDVVRAATPIVNQLLDRTWPKKQEQQIQTNITITLSTHQAAKLDDEELKSEAIDVPYEVISEEQVA